MNLFSELKRRNVFKVAIAFLMLSWLILQLVDVLTPILDLPESFARVVFVALLILLPITLIISWAFELTPDGIKKSEDVDQEQSIRQTTGQKINYIIIGFLILVVGFQYWGGGDEPAPQEVVIDEPAPEPVATEPTIPVNSIAVLPFINMSSDPEQEYFSDGISEEILNVLAQIKDLRVTSRSSSFQFKGNGLDLPAVARQLGVSKILEGSVRKSGNRIRITAQLIEAETDVHLWSETYDRDLSDIFAVQDEISKAIVDALKTTLNIDVAAVNFAQGTANVEAHEQYMLGLYLIRTFAIETLNQAKVHFENATRLDPDYAEPWAKLVQTNILASNRYYGTTPISEAMKQAEIAVNKAESLNPDLAETQHALGYYHWHLEDDRYHVKTLSHLHRAVELNSNFADAYRIIGRVNANIGQPDEFRNNMELAEKYDPMSLLIKNNLAGSYIANNRLDKAAITVERMIAIDNNSSATSNSQLILLNAQGQYAQVIFQYHQRLKRGGTVDMIDNANASRALATIGLNERSLSLVAGTRAETRSYYRNQQFDKFIQSARSDYEKDPNRLNTVENKARAEMLAGNYKLSETLYEEIEVCQSPIDYQPCGRLLFVKRMLGDTQGAAESLEKIQNLETKAKNEGWRLSGGNLNEIGEAYTLVMQGEIDQAFTIYKEQLALDFYHNQILAPHFKELHDHPGWPAFLEDIKAWQAYQQAKLAELEAGS